MEIQLEEITHSVPVATSGDSLPAVLTSAQITEARLREIEGYRQFVVADPLDKAGAKEANRLRLDAKAVRTGSARIIKKKREDAMRTNQWWLALDHQIAGRIEPVEEYLQAIVDRHEAALEAMRLQAEKARAAKLQARVDACTAADVAPDVVRASTLSDEDWSTWLCGAVDAASREADLYILHQELNDLGDPCTLEEAGALSTEDAKARLDKAREAAHHRAEDARLAAEEVKRIADEERERLELGQRRLAEMIRLGAEQGVTMEQLSILTVESWEQIKSVATEAWNNRRRIAQEERADLERLRKIEADRLATEKEAQEAADAQKAQEAAKAARLERERLDADHQERIRPDREAIRAWLVEYGRALPAWPDVQDDALAQAVETARDDIGAALRALAGVVAK